MGECASCAMLRTDLAEAKGSFNIATGLMKERMKEVIQLSSALEKLRPVLNEFERVSRHKTLWTDIFRVQVTEAMKTLNTALGR